MTDGSIDVIWSRIQDALADINYLEPRTHSEFFQLLDEFDDAGGWDSTYTDDLRSLVHESVVRKPNYGFTRRLFEWLAEKGPDQFIRPLILESLATEAANASGLMRLGLQRKVAATAMLEALAANPLDPPVRAALRSWLHWSKIPSDELTAAWEGLPYTDRVRFDGLLDEAIVESFGSRVNDLLRYWNRALRRRPEDPRELEFFVKLYRDELSTWYEFQNRVARLTRQFGRRLPTSATVPATMTRMPPLPDFPGSLLPFPAPLSPTTVLETAFASKLGFSLDTPIRFEYADELRFEYLLEYGDTRQRRVDSFIREAGFEPERLIRLQSSADERLDELAGLQHQYETLARKIQADTERREQPSSEKLDDLAKKIHNLSREFSEEGEYSQLRLVSTRLLPELREAGVSWRRLDTEGILGEFHPLNGTARIYRGMIQLAANGPQLSGLGNSREIAASLQTIAEIHEAAHGYLIQGKTCDDAKWDSYGSVSYGMHEALAMAYTRRIAEVVQADEELTRLLDAVESLLPSEYRISRQLDAVTSECLRRFLQQVRTQTNQSLLESWYELVEALGNQQAMVAVAAGQNEYSKLQQLVADSRNAVASTGNLQDATETIVNFYRNIASTNPQLVPFLTGLAPAAWPGDEELACRAVTDLSQGPEVGPRRSLRLRMSWISGSPGRSSILPDDKINNIPSYGIDDYEKVLAKIGIDNDILSKLLARYRDREDEL